MLELKTGFNRYIYIFFFIIRLIKSEQICIRIGLIIVFLFNIILQLNAIVNVLAIFVYLLYVMKCINYYLLINFTIQKYRLCQFLHNLFRKNIEAL